jgi:hypothetical protein
MSRTRYACTDNAGRREEKRNAIVFVEFISSVVSTISSEECPIRSFADPYRHFQTHNFDDLTEIRLHTGAELSGSLKRFR